MKRSRLVIAIDGPAGVGKSTVGCLVAKRLGYKFINTGEMYRALTWKAMEERTDLRDGRALTSLAKRLRWGFAAGSEGVVIRTTLDGRSVSRHIADERVSRNTSAIAGVPGVRRHMRTLQRRLGRDGGIVMEGRDIATNVFPDAELKIYLDASIDERASRRTRQLRSQGHKVRLQDIRQAIAERDRHDLQRRINPLRQAADAVVVDSTSLTLQAVAGRILRLVKARRGRL